MNNIRQLLFASIAEKYSSTQENFHQRGIDQLIGDNVTPAALKFDDLIDFDQQQEFLKRFYYFKEYANKMILFGDYYRLHKDKARIVHKDLEYDYEKWHYKHRKLLFKQKDEESKQPSNQSSSDDIRYNTHVTAFLLNISTYNPYSKKYYLRRKSKIDVKEKKIDRSGRSVESFLNHVFQNNKFAEQLSQISYIKNKHNRYYSVDEIFGGNISDKSFKKTKRSSSRIILTFRKSNNNIINIRKTQSVKVLALRGSKLRNDSIDQKTMDRIVNNRSEKLISHTEAPSRPAIRRSVLPQQLKSLDKQFSDKKFQVTKIPKLKNLPNEKIQKVNKLLQLKLKC